MHTASFWNITIQWTSHDDLTEKKSESFCVCQFWKLLKKFVKSECEESYKNDLTEIFWVRFFQKQMFFPKSSNWSGGQTHGWIFMK